MISEGVPLFLFQLAFLFLFFFLALDNAQEVVTLGLGLVGHGGLTLHELALAGNLELFSLSLQLLALSDLFSAGFTLLLFESALGTESVNLGLSIGGFFLHFS